MTTARRPTRAAGAVIERHLMRQYLLRQLRTLTNERCFGERRWHRDGEVAALERVLAWLASQPGRLMRPGGLGRR